MRQGDWVALIVFAFGLLVTGDAHAQVVCDRAGEEACAKECRAGNTDHCLELKVIHAEGIDGPVDLVKARKYSAIGCEHGSTQACDFAAWYELSGEGGSKDVKRALARVRISCKEGSKWACVTAGEIYRWGTAGVVDISTSEAKSYFDKGCGRDFAKSCLDLGILHREDGEDSKAVAAFRRGCTYRSADACNRVGVAYARGLGVEPSNTEAIKFYNLACDLGDWHACRNLGVRYRDGNAVAKDLKRAQTIFTRLCREGMRVACADVAGIILKSGHGLGAAFPWYAKACVKVDLEACRILGNKLSRLEERPKWLSEDIPRKWCQPEKTPGACAVIGLRASATIENPELLKPEAAETKMLAGCAGSWRGSNCRELGEMYVEGGFLKKSNKKALDVFEKACAMGDAVSCDRAADLLPEGGASDQKFNELRKRACALDLENCVGFPMSLP